MRNTFQLCFLVILFMDYVAKCPLKQILRKEQPKRLAIRGARDMFFPYWKSVLSARMKVKMSPPCQPSGKDMRSTEPNSEGVTHTLYFPSQPVQCPSWMARPLMSYASRRQFSAVASRSLKVFKRVWMENVLWYACWNTISLLRLSFFKAISD